VDIASFLRRHPPFDDLDDAGAAEVVRATHIEFFPAGETVLAQGGAPAQYLYLVRTGAVEVLDGEHVVDLHQQGEIFAYVSLLTGDVPALGVRANEETICYLVDREVAVRILSSRTGLSFLSRSVRRREMSLLESTEAVFAADPWATPLSAADVRAPLMVDAALSVREAAERMTAERVSALLVRLPSGWGIVTDRDLRSRVLARGLAETTPVGEIATAPVLMLEDADTIGEALSAMLERGIHHIPVTSKGGEIWSVVTDTDLIALDRRSAFRLRRDLDGAMSAEDVARVAWAAPAMISDLVEASADPLDIARVAAVTNDALTVRLIELGTEQLGEPPCGWAWLALGSEARREQGVFTDQDNALAYEEDGDDAYFAALATYVNDGLAQAGIPRCRAGVIAANAEWRGPLSCWQERFRSWIQDPGRSGSAFSGIAFDFRVVAGPLEAHPALDPIIRSAGRDTMYMRHLARNAVDQRPPSGFLRDAVVDARGATEVTFDVKRGGISPITNIARIHALRSGLTDNRTVRRLSGAAVTGLLTEEDALGMEEAFRLLWQVRLEHQAGQVRAGLLPDDEVDPRVLGPLTRQALKEVFRLIGRMQDQLAAELGVRR
jgi:CBS domain-containing protein